jgi:hypothetical protein
MGSAEAPIAPNEGATEASPGALASAGPTAWALDVFARSGLDFDSARRLPFEGGGFPPLPWDLLPVEADPDLLSELPFTFIDIDPFAELCHEFSFERRRPDENERHPARHTFRGLK